MKVVNSEDSLADANQIKVCDIVLSDSKEE